jgi:hypothetical protein
MVRPLKLLAQLLPEVICRNSYRVKLEPQAADLTGRQLSMKSRKSI